jgi:hypothetical protein
MENFKEIDFKGRIHCVTETGKVLQYNRTKYRKTFPNTSGYEYFTLDKAYLVHRMVAIAYIPNPLNKKFVNHIDGNKWNNHVSNLEWVTKSENELHSIRVLGNKRDIKGLEKSWVDSPNKKKINLFNLNGNFIREFNSQKECAKFLNVSNAAVSNHILGMTKKIGIHYKLKR